MKLLVVGCLLCSVLVPLGAAQARTWHIKPDGTGDVPTIWAGIDSAAVGDSVILACGNYTSATERIIGIWLKPGICLASETGSPDCVTISAHGMGTVLGGGGLDKSTVIKGLTIAHGSAICGMGVGCRGGGMYLGDSSPTIINCRFVGNWAGSFEGMTRLGGGVYCKNSTPTFVGCVFERNVAGTAGGGMYCESSSPTLINCTFAQNRAPEGAGIFWDGGASPATITNTIVAFNLESEAIGGPGYSGTLTLACCDVYGNAGGDWVGMIAGQAGRHGNFSLDPLFCDLAGDDYTLKQCSPCAPGNHRLGWGCDWTLIGALPVGCPGISIEQVTWGRIKVMFR